MATGPARAGKGNKIMGTNAVFQTSFSNRPSEAIIGQMAESFSPGHRIPRIARGLVKAGYGQFKVAGTGSRGQFPTKIGECYHIPNPGPAADVDAITVAGTSATGTSTLADGVVGATEMQPARRLTITFNASTDWDPSTGVITLLDHAGRLVSENVAIATSTSVTTTAYASLFVSFTKPAQTGAGGAYTIGVAAQSALTIDDFLGVAIRQVIKETLSTSDLYRKMGGATSNLVTADYIDGETVPVLEQGAIWVYSEEAVADRDPVYVRVASGAGGSVLGAFRNDADTASCVRVTGARFVRDSSDAGPAWVRFGIGF